MRCYTVAAWNTDKLIVNDNLTVTWVLEADTIAPRTANEATVNGYFAVSGAFLVDTVRTGEATHICIDDSVTISVTTVANNLSGQWHFKLRVQIKNNRLDPGVDRIRQH